MSRRYPKDVAEAHVYQAFLGFQYTCRDQEGKIVYESPRSFRSRFDARREISRRWPKARVSFGK